MLDYLGCKCFLVSAVILLGLLCAPGPAQAQEEETPPGPFSGGQGNQGDPLEDKGKTNTSDTTTVSPCEDQHPNCNMWAMAEECWLNPHYMVKRCPVSCWTCPYVLDCTDDEAYAAKCPDWVGTDQCIENAVWMKVHCFRSCGYCRQQNWTATMEREQEKTEPSDVTPTTVVSRRSSATKDMTPSAVASTKSTVTVITDEFSPSAESTTPAISPSRSMNVTTVESVISSRSTTTTTKTTSYSASVSSTAEPSMTPTSKTAISSGSTMDPSDKEPEGLSSSTIQTSQPSESTHSKPSSLTPKATVPSSSTSPTERSYNESAASTTSDLTASSKFPTSTEIITEQPIKSSTQSSLRTEESSSSITPSFSTTFKSTSLLQSSIEPPTEQPSTSRQPSTEATSKSTQKISTEGAPSTTKSSTLPSSTPVSSTKMETPIDSSSTVSNTMALSSSTQPSPSGKHDIKGPTTVTTEKTSMLDVESTKPTDGQGLVSSPNKMSTSVMTDLLEEKTIESSNSTIHFLKTTTSTSGPSTKERQEGTTSNLTSTVSTIATTMLEGPTEKGTDEQFSTKLQTTISPMPTGEKASVSQSTTTHILEALSTSMLTDRTSSIPTGSTIKSQSSTIEEGISITKDLVSTVRDQTISTMKRTTATIDDIKTVETLSPTVPSFSTLSSETPTETPKAQSVTRTLSDSSTQATPGRSKVSSTASSTIPIQTTTLSDTSTTMMSSQGEGVKATSDSTPTTESSTQGPVTKTTKQVVDQKEKTTRTSFGPTSSTTIESFVTSKSTVMVDSKATDISPSMESTSSQSSSTPKNRIIPISETTLTEGKSTQDLVTEKVTSISIPESSTASIPSSTTTSSTAKVPSQPIFDESTSVSTLKTTAFVSSSSSKESPTTASSSTLESTTLSDCVNNWGDDNDCTSWSEVGECASNANWMRDYCYKACGYCISQATTKSTTAGAICTNDPDYDDGSCDVWASIGECIKNEDWMNTYCAKSCGTCKGSTTNISSKPTLENTEDITTTTPSTMSTTPTLRSTTMMSTNVDSTPSLTSPSVKSTTVMSTSTDSTTMSTSPTFKSSTIKSTAPSLNASAGLLFSNETHILYYDGVSVKVLVSQERGSIVGLGVDVAKGLIFWSNLAWNQRGIYRATLDGQNQTKIISKDIFEVNGLTVDYASGHVYWTDAVRRRVEMADYEGGNRRVVISRGLVAPRGIVADPLHGYLFWGDQGTRTISRSLLDGSDQRVIVKDGLVWPNQLAIFNNDLLFVDGWNKTLSSVDLDGRDRKLVAPLEDVVGDHPLFGLAVANKSAYVTSWGTGRLIKTALLGGAETPSTVLHGLSKEVMFSLASTDAVEQPESLNPCSWRDKGGCSHLCLPTGVFTYRCSCPSVGGLVSRGKECVVPESVLLYADADLGQVTFTDPAAKVTEEYIVGTSPRPVAVGYDPVDQVVYWSDVQERSIHRVYLNGSGHTVLLNASHGLGFVDGIFVDWIHRKLYFTNADFVTLDGTAFTWHRIEVIGLDGKGRRSVITDVEQPRGLWVDMEAGYLYYTDWGSEARLVRSRLDGSQQQILRDGLQNPNDVIMMADTIYVIDSHVKAREAGRVDSKGALYRLDRESQDWTRVDDIKLEIPFGLTSAGNTLYISDWGLRAILAYDVTTGQTTNIVNDIYEPMGVFYTAVTKQLPAEDVCDAASCPDVCLTSVPGFARCACSSDNAKVKATFGGCVEPDNFVLIADLNEIRLVSQSPADSHVYTVISGNRYAASFSALVWDAQRNVFYFSDVNRGILYEGDLSGRYNILYNAGDVIDGLVLGKSGSILYWTAQNEGAIYRLDLDNPGSNATKVASGLNQPKSLVYSPESGELYWTEVGNPAAVKRLSEDGGVPTTIWESSDEHPRNIFLDEQRRWVGFSLSDHSTYTCSVVTDDQCVRRKSLPESAGIVPSKISVGDYIYYSDWQKGSILRSPWQDNSSVVTVIDGLMRPTQFVIVTRTYTNDMCGSNHKCSDICISLPLDYACVCYMGRSLLADGKQCYDSISSSTTTASTIQFTSTTTKHTSPTLSDVKTSPTDRPKSTILTEIPTSSTLSYMIPDITGPPTTTETTSTLSTQISIKSTQVSPTSDIRSSSETLSSNSTSTPPSPISLTTTGGKDAIKSTTGTTSAGIDSKPSSVVSSSLVPSTLSSSSTTPSVLPTSTRVTERPTIPSTLSSTSTTRLSSSSEKMITEQSTTTTSTSTSTLASTPSVSTESSTVMLPSTTSQKTVSTTLQSTEAVTREAATSSSSTDSSSLTSRSTTSPITLSTTLQSTEAVVTTQQVATSSLTTQSSTLPTTSTTEASSKLQSTEIIATEQSVTPSTSTKVAATSQSKTTATMTKETSPRSSSTTEMPTTPSTTLVTESTLTGPVFSSCPRNRTALLERTGERVQIWWLEPIAVDENGDIVEDVKVNKKPGAYFKSGVSFVTYTATDKEGRLAKCTFFITVDKREEFSCTGMPAPLNGDMVCQTEEYVYTCQVACRPGYELNPQIASLRPACRNTGWSPEFPADYISTSCIKRTELQQIQPVILAYSGGCAEGVTEDFNQAFITKLQWNFRNAGLCPPVPADDGLGLCDPTSYALRCDTGIGLRKRRQVERLRVNVTLSAPASDPSGQNEQRMRETRENIELLLLSNRLDVVVDDTQYVAQQVAPLQPGSIGCPPGQSVVGKSCVLCPAGSFLNAGGQCESCPSGSYQPRPAATGCLQCPIGTAAPTGAFSAEQCVGQAGPQPSPSTSNPSNNISIPIVIGLCVAAGIVLVVTVGCAVYALRKVFKSKGQMKLDQEKAMLNGSNGVRYTNPAFVARPQEETASIRDTTPRYVGVTKVPAGNDTLNSKPGVAAQQPIQYRRLPNGQVVGVVAMTTPGTGTNSKVRIPPVKSRKYEMKHPAAIRAAPSTVPTNRPTTEPHGMYRKYQHQPVSGWQGMSEADKLNQ